MPAPVRDISGQSVYIYIQIKCDVLPVGQAGGYNTCVCFSSDVGGIFRETCTKTCWILKTVRCFNLLFYLYPTLPFASVTNYYRLLLTQMKPASKLTCLCIYFSQSTFQSTFPASRQDKWANDAWFALALILSFTHCAARCGVYPRKDLLSKLGFAVTCSLVIV